MEVVNRCKNCGVVSKSPPRDANIMIQVEISEEAKGYIRDRTGTVVVEIETSFG